MAKTHWVKSGAGFEENSPLADCNEKFDQSLEIINAFQGENATELYKLLTTVKKGE